jgi:hypothetical protein
MKKGARNSETHFTEGNKGNEDYKFGLNTHPLVAFVIFCVKPFL